MSFDNEFVFNIDRFPLFPETFQLDLRFLLTLLNSQLEKLSINVHTQSLLVEIERAKRQKLSSAPKRVRRNLIFPKRISTQINDDLDTVLERVRELQLMYENKVARIGTVFYRSLGQIHQLLISFTPYIPITAETHSDVSQLNYELFRTI